MSFIYNTIYTRLRSVLQYPLVYTIMTSQDILQVTMCRPLFYVDIYFDKRT